MEVLIITERGYDLDYSFIFKFVYKIWRNRLNEELKKINERYVCRMTIRLWWYSILRIYFYVIIYKKS